MTGQAQQNDAEVIVGVFDRGGSAAGSGPADRDGTEAEVIRFAPYLLARRGRAVARPASGG